MMSRVGRLFYDRGEDIYNFQGVRKFKDKYDPLWQPRYIAAPHKWGSPLIGRCRASVLWRCGRSG